MEIFFIILGIFVVGICGIKLCWDYFSRKKSEEKWIQQKQGVPSVNIDKIEKESNKHKINIEGESFFGVPPTDIKSWLTKNTNWINAAVIIMAVGLAWYFWKKRR